MSCSLSLSYTEWELANTSDLIFAMKSVLDRMWSALPEKGLGKDLFAHVHEFRNSLPPLVMTTQLYSVFSGNHTFVDRELLRCVQTRQIRRLMVNLVDGGEVVIENTQYISLLDRVISSLDKKKADDSQSSEIARDLTLFKQLYEKLPEALSLRLDQLKEVGIQNPSNIITAGFLTLLSGRLNEFNISIPNIGPYLRLVAGARQWIIKMLSKMTWKEALEDLMIERWESNKFQWKDFRGVRIQWALCDCKGGGWCEPFNTPVGQGWKLTGKR